MQVETLFGQYMTVVWIILGLIAVFFIGRYFLQKHREKKPKNES
jgi:uncharacterized protein YneF (UPF0154 family)